MTMSEYLTKFDIWISQQKLPMRIRGFCRRIEDTDCIILNEDLATERKYEVIEHELRHFVRNDLQSGESVGQIESRIRKTK